MSVVRQNKVRAITLLLAVFKSYRKLLHLCSLALKKKRNRVWTRTIYSEHERQLHGFFNKLSVIIKNQNTDEFKKVTRMDVNTFTRLKQLVHERIKKKDFIRESISSECRLAITLVYLAHGVDRQVLAWSFRVGVSTIRKIILETCEAIWDELNEIYLAPPNEAEWERIGDEFFQKSGMPHVVGAIDGKNLQIMFPPRSRSLDQKYKQCFSIVVLASCDSNYTFTAVDVGTYGSQCDAGILKASGFGNKILTEKINIPKAKLLPNSNDEFPFYFVGDSAFPLKRNIMRPYPGKNLPTDKLNFNKKLSKARVRIENTFGILAARWRILTSSFNMVPENAEKIVRATLVLHNFVKSHDSAIYCPENYVDHITKAGEVIKGEWRLEVRPLDQSRLFTRFNAPREAFAMRDFLKNYLDSS